MALLKRDTKILLEPLMTFNSCEDAILSFESNFDDFEAQSNAARALIEFDGGSTYLAKRLLDNGPYIGKEMSVYIASMLSSVDAKKAPIDSVMELLKVNNAFIRSLGISILQSYGDIIQEHIVRFLKGKDKDLRIFAINVLGDVNFPKSKKMLVELLEREFDINVAMTAVDYMGEIGEERDIELLESLKKRFNDDYANFAIDGAIRLIRG
jgi:HEAT repeat protein